MASNGSTQRAVCGARKRQGEGQCQRPAGWGTDHVGIGACKLHGGCLPNHAIAAAKKEAAAHTAIDGIPVDPATALLRCVHLAAGQVEYALRQLHALAAKSKSPDELTQSPWARVQSEAMERLARFSKMALDAGVAERQVQIAERWGAELADVMRAIFDDLGLSDEQKLLAPGAIQRHLSVFEEGAAAPAIQSPKGTN